MKSLLHWIAAAWVVVVGTVLTLGLLAVLCYVVYLALSEWDSILTIIAAIFAFLWSCHWAGGYIDDHGWPWKPKHQSERGEPT